MGQHQRNFFSVFLANFCIWQPFNLGNPVCGRALEFPESLYAVLECDI